MKHLLIITLLFCSVVVSAQHSKRGVAPKPETKITTKGDTIHVLIPGWAQKDIQQIDAQIKAIAEGPTVQQQIDMLNFRRDQLLKDVIRFKGHDLDSLGPLQSIDKEKIVIGKTKQAPAHK